MLSIYQMSSIREKTLQFLFDYFAYPVGCGWATRCGENATCYKDKRYGNYSWRWRIYDFLEKFLDWLPAKITKALVNANKRI